MQVVISAVMLSVVMLCASFGLCGEPAKNKAGFEFGRVIWCDQEKRKENCLAESFKPGFKVVLISEKGTCTAKTGTSFTYNHPGGDFTATRLEDEKECTGIVSSLAVVGIDEPSVRVVPAKKNPEFLTKERDARARKLIESSVHEATRSAWPINYSSPKVLTAGQWTVLKYEVEGEEGPPILFISDKPFLLDEWCTYGHDFFSVNGKLYFNYGYYCCGCGYSGILVYDLSSGVPKRVYINGELSY